MPAVWLSFAVPARNKMANHTQHFVTQHSVASCFGCVSGIPASYLEDVKDA